MSHSGPERFGGQTHSKPPPNIALQRLFDGHGFDAHSVKHTSQRIPVHPHGHLHENESPAGEHTPSFKHGLLSHTEPT